MTQDFFFDIFLTIKRIYNLTGQWVQSNCIDCEVTAKGGLFKGKVRGDLNRESFMSRSIFDLGSGQGNLDWQAF
jgi:hypothetical protein